MEATEQFLWAFVGMAGIVIVLSLAGLFFIGREVYRLIKRNKK